MRVTAFTKRTESPYRMPEERIPESGVWIWCEEKNSLFFSESFSRLIGLPENEVFTLESLAERIYPEDLDPFFEILERMVDGYWPGNFTFRVRSSDLSVRVVRCVIGVMEKEVVGVCYQLDN